LGREMFIKFTFGSRLKKFGNHCSRRRWSSVSMENGYTDDRTSS